MKICLSVLMGLPGSGKTTFAKALKQIDALPDGQPCQFIHVCYDDLIPYVDFHDYSESDVTWKHLRENVLNQIDLLLISLKANSLDKCPPSFRNQIEFEQTDTAVVILIDDNMYLKSMRYALYKKAKEYNVCFCQLYIKCSIELAVERNMLRSSDCIVPHHVIHGMHCKFEEPKTDNKWERYSLVVNTSNDINEQLYEYFTLLNKSFEDPVCMEIDKADEKQESIIICMTNLIHQSDIALRQIINRKMQDFLMENKCGDGKKSEVKTFSADLSSKKVKVLNGIKEGAITVPDNVLHEVKQDEVLDKKCLKLFLDNCLTSVSK